MYYCSSVWAGTTKKNIARLQKVQNFAARIVTGTRKFDHISPTLKELHWLPVAQQLEIRDTVMAFKCIKGQAPSYLKEKCAKRADVHSINTRNKDELNIPLCRTVTGQRSFAYRAVSLWNNLPSHISEINTLQEFKNAIKKSALNNFIL